MSPRVFRVVTSRGLNVRAGCGVEHPRVLVLERGEAIELRGRVGDWIRIRVGTVEGWVAERYTLEHPVPWMAIAEMEEARGVRELAGAAENPRIIEYHAETSLKATRDEVAWCSAFACWCMEQAGIRSTRSAAARSWVGWGRAIEHPVPGCIAIFRRGGNPKQGHVAFYVGRQGDRIQVLGGNQSNRVSIASYAAHQLIGYRMPV